MKSSATARGEAKTTEAAGHNASCSRVMGSVVVVADGGSVVGVVVVEVAKGASVAGVGVSSPVQVAKTTRLATTVRTCVL